MGTTPSGGLPYPEPTDAIAQGANAIRLLARGIQGGTIAITGPGNNAQGTGTVTFNPPFAAPPIITASVSNWNWIAQVGNVTTTGCTIAIGRRDATTTWTQTITVYWVAIGQAAS
jgi:hypothetical protein